MKATITKEIEMSCSEIKIGNFTLSEILDFIYTKTENTVQDISIERQRDKPNLEYLDSELCSVLNFIEDIRRF
jgi:hypothetical protein